MEISKSKFPIMAIWLGITILLVIPRLGAQMTSQEQTGWANPYKQLDNAAGLVKNSNDETSIRGLADAIFSFPRALPRMPQEIENIIKERLVRADIAYRSGTQNGVLENDIVGLINSTADRLGLPSYAKTSARQVRVLRMQLTFSSPAFMGAGAIKPGMKIGESISDRLSPLQAAHVLNSLIDQKIINPEYQLDPEEWERTQLPASVAKVQKQMAQSQSSAQPASQSKAEVRVVRRKRDLQDAIVQAGSSMGFVDTMNLIDQAFITLKIGR